MAGGLTPGARPDLESCIRTLMVSSGWQHSYMRNAKVDRGSQPGRGSRKERSRNMARGPGRAWHRSRRIRRWGQEYERELASTFVRRLKVARGSGRQRGVTYRFHRACDASSGQLCGEPDGLLLCGARHIGVRSCTLVVYELDVRVTGDERTEQLERYVGL